MITNPPYGERISTNNLFATYKMIGERLKHALIGGEAWIISYHYECFDKIGLKPSAKIPLFNGALPCELRKYEIFDGRYNDFRGGDRRLKKDDLPSRRSGTLRHKARLAEREEARKAEKPFHKSEAGKPFHKSEGKKPFHKSEGSKPFHKSEGKKPFRKTENKPFRNNKK